MSRNLNAQHKKQHKHESGQAIIIIAVVMVGLMGMLGMAIDGGGLYVLHRDTQNAVDAALVAATYAQCAGSSPSAANIIQAGLQAASLNGFDNGVNGTVVTINPFYTPDEGGSDNYVEVIIEATKPSYFIQLVYPEPLKVTTRGVGYCKPSTQGLLPANSALISFTDSASCSQAGAAIGNNGGSAMIIHGGVFVNTNNNCNIRTQSAVASFIAEGPCNLVGTYTATNVDCQGGVTHPAQLTDMHPLSDLERPQCPEGTDIDGDTYGPGTYDEIAVKNKDVILLTPGIYCVNHFKFTGGTLTGTDVVIYMPPGNRGIDGHGTTVDLVGPNVGDTPSCTVGVTCQWSGLLIWSDMTNPNGGVEENDPIKINAQSNSRYWGMIYAPGSSCELEGGSLNSIHGVLACLKVRGEGGGELHVWYERPEFLNQPPYVGIAE